MACATVAANRSLILVSLLLNIFSLSFPIAFNFAVLFVRYCCRGRGRVCWRLQETLSVSQLVSLSQSLPVSLRSCWRRWLRSFFFGLLSEWNGLLCFFPVFPNIQVKKSIILKSIPKWSITKECVKWNQKRKTRVRVKEESKKEGSVKSEEFRVKLQRQNVLLPLLLHHHRLRFSRGCVCRREHEREKE